MNDDEGFGKLYRYHGMDHPLKSVEISEDKTLLTFHFLDGKPAYFRTEGDCCSTTWIEHLEIVPDDLTGARISAIHDDRISRTDETFSEGCLQVYKTIFRTDRGDIIVEYRNSSNGYYGGNLRRASGPNDGGYFDWDGKEDA